MYMFLILIYDNNNEHNTELYTVYMNIIVSYNTELLSLLSSLSTTKSTKSIYTYYLILIYVYVPSL